MIGFHCKDCGLKLSVQDQHSGKRVKCPKCGIVGVVPDKPDKIKFHCKSCGQSICVPHIHAGKKGKCPKCKNPVVVPSCGRKPTIDAGTFSIVCSMCEETIQVPETSRGQTIECPACGSYVEASSGDVLAGSATSGPSIPSGTDEEQYEEESDVPDEVAGIGRRLILVISGAAVVVVVGLIILIAVIVPSGSQPVEDLESRLERQEVADTETRSQPTANTNQEPGSQELSNVSASTESSPLHAEGGDASVARSSGPKQKTIDLGNGVTMRFVLIPAGEFMMGSPDRESGRSNREGPRHQVKLTEPFYMSTTEVTQQEYSQIMGNNPNKFEGADNPVETVSWNDAMEFCRKLSERTGNKITLPTEAQWEYACRAGTDTRFSFGEDDQLLESYCWYLLNSSRQSHPVATKKPNAWGLYDMHGNVWEWCSDWYSFYSSSPSVDPNGPPSGRFRVVRGGSWDCIPRGCRSANRGWNSPGLWLNGVGFRIVLNLR